MRYLIFSFLFLYVLFTLTSCITEKKGTPVKEGYTRVTFSFRMSDEVKKQYALKEKKALNLEACKQIRKAKDNHNQLARCANLIVEDRFFLKVPHPIRFNLSSITNESGTLVFGTTNAGVIVTDHDYKDYYQIDKVDPKVQFNHVRETAFDPLSDKVYFSMTNWLYSKDNNTNEILERTSWHGIANGLIYKIHVKNEHVGLATFGGFALSSDNGLSFKFHTYWEGLPDSRVFDLDSDDLGTYYLATQKGFSKYYEGRFQNNLKGIHLSSLDYDPYSQSIYATSSEGVFLSKDEGDTFVKVTPKVYDKILNLGNLKALVLKDNKLFSLDEEGEEISLLPGEKIIDFTMNSEGAVTLLTPNNIYREM